MFTPRKLKVAVYIYTIHTIDNIFVLFFCCRSFCVAPFDLLYTENVQFFFRDNNDIKLFSYFHMMRVAISRNEAERVSCSRYVRYILAKVEQQKLNETKPSEIEIKNGQIKKKITHL